MQIPTGATHVAEGNIYYKKHGQFWYRYNSHSNGWIALSGEPSLPVVKIKNGK